jgi:hypothetical protein
VFSPDGDYVAKVYDGYSYPSGRETIEIQDAKGTVLWPIPYQGELPTGDPRPYLSIYQWSKDSAYLYFYYGFSFDGAHTLWDGFDLRLIDVKTGYIQRVIIGTGLTAFSFSPNERYLAYTRADDSPRVLIIRDMKNGTERSIIAHPVSENYIRAGWIRWSSDGREIVYHTIENEWIQVFHVDVDTMHVKMVFEYWVESYWFHGWAENGNLEFIQYTDDWNFDIYEVNLGMSELILIGTPTPSPTPFP